ncbi:hypothetical protein Hanom_Chr13g01244171 [Helianthus anomalus]
MKYSLRNSLFYFNMINISKLTNMCFFIPPQITIISSFMPNLNTKHYPNSSCTQKTSG